ncbi:VOC family protein [Tropicimonas marinistellae]|uniref:VOC family protein n=1 Tax=Tropicimonas marinistellae TaxID=1739787 RepID=UPI000832A610|nr:VOC family protein [Tropicimonas marinistellae]
MKLGAFSMSLSVADLPASRAFYEALGFAQVAGAPEEGWIILRNGGCTLGLFQGMFEGNMLTFNPGWLNEETPDPDFTDIREIQTRLLAQGIAIESETDPDATGPASLLVRDPDGNAVFLDQHVSAPGHQ